MPQTFRIRAGAVVSEIIDGEAVIMQMRTGHYFSTRGTGAVLWDLIQRGVDLDTAAQWFAAASGHAIEDIAPAIQAFIEDATRHALGDIAEVASSAVDGELPPLPAGWTAPKLEVFTDMEDLLLLDPIHDVSEEAGWPMPKPANTEQ